jgi:electron transfer flavoprotein beta subunit
MNLAVFVKHVPDTAEADLQVAGDGRSLKGRDELPHQMNEWDRFALEEAVRLKEAAGGTLTAFLLGPESCEESLRRCLAVGADRAVRVWDGALEEKGPWAVAATLAAAVGDARCDLYLCGAQADDDGSGFVGPALATLLALPSAVLVNHLEVAGGKAVCSRELEAGWTERVALDLPALVTVQTGINEPRYVSILGIRKARAKPVDVFDLAALGLDRETFGKVADLTCTEALTLPPPEGAAELLEGTPEQIAAGFVAVLRERGAL